MIFKLFVFLSIFFVNISAIHAEILRTHIGDWHPYISDKLQDHGPAHDYFKKIANTAGYAVETVYSTWQEAFKNASQDELGVTYPWGITPKRQKLFYFSKYPIMLSQEFVFYIPNRFDGSRITSFTQLQGIRVAYPRTYASETYIKKASANLVPVENEAEGLQAVYENKADLYIGEPIVAQNFISHNPKYIHVFERAKTPIITRNLYALFSKKNPTALEALKRFNTAHRKIGPNKWW